MELTYWFMFARIFIFVSFETKRNENIKMGEQLCVEQIRTAHSYMCVYIDHWPRIIIVDNISFVHLFRFIVVAGFFFALAKWKKEKKKWKKETLRHTTAQHNSAQIYSPSTPTDIVTRVVCVCVDREERWEIDLRPSKTQGHLVH